MENSKNNPLQINSTPVYPNSADTFDVKKQNDWGLAFGKAIESEWFSKTSGDCRFFTQRNQFAERRIYAKGLQPMKPHIESIAINKDSSYINLENLKAVSVIPKNVDILVNGFMQRDYSITAYSVDPIGQEERYNFRDELNKDRVTKDLAIQAKELLGQDITSVPLDQIPETEEEVDFYMKMRYKPSYEISEELALQTVFEENEYKTLVRTRVITDLVTCGVGWEKDRFVPEKGIVIEYVDCMNVVHPYTERPDFKDCLYFGEVKEVLISDLSVEFPWIDTDAEVKEEIKSSGQRWWNYHNMSSDANLRGKTQLLYFTCTTTRQTPRKIKTEKNGAKTVSKAKAEFYGDKEGLDYERAVKVDEVIFEGILVLGTEILLKWEPMNYINRPKSSPKRVIQPYRGYAPNKEKAFIDSLVNRMIPIDDEIQLTRVKRIQIIQKIKPDGFQIDADGLAELDFGNGNVISIEDNLNMFSQTGDLIVRSLSSDGGMNAGKKIVEELRQGGSLDKLRALDTEISIGLQLMDSVIGLNSASNANTPDKDTAVGAMKIGVLTSNTATRHIQDASNYLMKKTAESCVGRISDLIEYSNLKDDFIRKIGATSVKDLREISKLHLYDFAIYLDLELDDEEKAKLELDLSKEIDKGYIDTENKYEIMNIKNAKLRTEYLAILRKKRQQKMQEMESAKFKEQADQNIRAAQEAEKARQATEAMILEGKMKLQQITNEGLNTKEITQGEQARLTEELKANKKYELQGLINSGNADKIDKMEQAKKDNLAKNATYQSEQIKQREVNGDPIDFEAKNAEDKIFELNEE